MEPLINSILNQGGMRDRLKAKVFGGAQITQACVFNVAASNISFVKNYLKTEAIEIVSEDLGGPVRCSFTQ